MSSFRHTGRKRFPNPVSVLFDNFTIIGSHFPSLLTFSFFVCKKPLVFCKSSLFFPHKQCFNNYGNGENPDIVQALIFFSSTQICVYVNFTSHQGANQKPRLIRILCVLYAMSGVNREKQGRVFKLIAPRGTLNGLCVCVCLSVVPFLF